MRRKAVLATRGGCCLPETPAPAPSSAGLLRLLVGPTKLKSISGVGLQGWWIAVSAPPTGAGRGITVRSRAGPEVGGAHARLNASGKLASYCEVVGLISAPRLPRSQARRLGGGWGEGLPGNTAAWPPSVQGRRLPPPAGGRCSPTKTRSSPGYTAPHALLKGPPSQGTESRRTNMQPDSGRGLEDAWGHGQKTRHSCNTGRREKQQDAARGAGGPLGEGQEAQNRGGH